MSENFPDPPPFDDEGPQLGFELASPWVRLGARLIDFLLGILVVALLAFALGGGDALDPSADTSDNLGSSFLGLIVWGVYEVSLTALYGRTLGKMALGIKVITTGGQDPPGWQPSAIRWALPAIAGLIPIIGFLFMLLAYLWIVWDRERQGLHDKAANTYVVRTSPGRPNFV